MMTALGLAACGPAIDVEDSAGNSGSSGFETTPRPDTSDPDPTRPDPSTTTMGPAPDPSTTEDRPTPDPFLLSGNYLLVVSSVLAPELPFQYLVVVDPTPTTAGFITADAWPLSLYVNSNNMPRERLEPPVSFEIGPQPEGLSFVFGVTIPGEANPITGSEVTAALSFSGVYIPERDFVCGSVEGQVTAPLEADLTGSTFSMIPIVDGLPEPFPMGCE